MSISRGSFRAIVGGVGALAAGVAGPTAFILASRYFLKGALENDSPAKAKKVAALPPMPTSTPSATPGISDIAQA